MVRARCCRGPNITITGDVMTITEQILELNPKYFEDGLGAAGERVTQASRAQSAWPPNCGQTWKGARVDFIQDGISYLYRLGGWAHLASSGCARVSCSFDSGIYICQHASFQQDVLWSEVADFAKGIVDVCTYKTTGAPKVKGNLFQINNYWEVVVHGEQKC
ncbi:hypothetical protein VTL71DRAFT_6798 [Oculimacula yallundae]|uniref:Uncharacterized protein n=1 Tax=Oculimacula yallundae TaxID=86028 RepID=A0ABR4BYN4_9HELO